MKPNNLPCSNEWMIDGWMDQLQERKEEVESLQSQLNGVQQRNEELERLR